MLTMACTTVSVRVKLLVCMQESPSLPLLPVLLHHLSPTCAGLPDVCHDEAVGRWPQSWNGSVSGPLLTPCLGW